ncbi:MAG: S8 family serine peptidase [Gammaproteobacteria bacterium]|nr:S8 family serine peptidase [Gammaproteobacteria bacterium]
MRFLTSALFLISTLMGSGFIVASQPAANSNLLTEQLKIKNPDQLHTYIVTLSDEPLATYKGGVKGISATSAKVNGKKKLDTSSSASIAYKGHLNSQHQKVLDLFSSQFKRSITPEHQYFNVVNGIAVKLTNKEAESVKHLAAVRSVVKDFLLHKQTDQGPLTIGADQVWSGIFNSTQARGEGVVVGVLDTGIHHDHPSFAEEASDGYIHTNPLGPNVYLGLCETTPSLCNAKLIGSYNFVAGSLENEDEDGHGTHVASTAVGNPVTFDLGNANSPTLSGVAPRANLISYKIAGENGSASFSTILAAINQAVTDQVDVINLSFGGKVFGTPWEFDDLLAFLNAREAGVVVVVSAGNEGSDPATVSWPGMAPWVTSVAASTHARGEFPTKRLSNMTGGDTPPPSEIVGRSLSGSITAPIVYAGDFSNGDNNPEQCLTPFPANTFNGEIVVCDRGQIARVDKAINVAAGGAGGFVLANVTGGAITLDDDIYVVPGIHISASDADQLRTWLATGSSHSATITGADSTFSVDSLAADIVAQFSSRGFNLNVPDVLVPTVTAPGVNILAADLDPADFGIKSGTSMASPHVAGAAALIIQLHPDWTVSAVHSSLATTAIASLKTHTGTDANAFDIGGGRIDVPGSLNAGLIFEESRTNFTAANPRAGGQPRTLNLPSATDASCEVLCTWNRTVTATESNTWNVLIDQDALGLISVSPNSFSLTEGQSQELMISASMEGEVADSNWLMGAVHFEPTGGAAGTSRIPVSARAKNSNFSEIYHGASATSAGSMFILNLNTIAESEPAMTGYLTQGVSSVRTVQGDSDNASRWFDDINDGTYFETVVVSTGKALMASTKSSSAANFDLYIGQDRNGNGQPDFSEIIDFSLSSGSSEILGVKNPLPGTYWILVHNSSGSSPSGDAVTLNTAVVPTSQSSNLTFVVPSSLDGVSSFDTTVSWSNLNPINTEWFGVVELGNSTDSDFIGSAMFRINRGATPDSNGGGDSGGSSGGGGALIFASLLVFLIGLRRRYSL